jgi:hypothetical protein
MWFLLSIFVDVCVCVCGVCFPVMWPHKLHHEGSHLRKQDTFSENNVIFSVPVADQDTQHEINDFMS